MEEDPDHPEEEVQDHLVEEEEDQDLLVEDNPQPHNNQCHLHQTSKQWEASHKYSTETNPKPTISSKKSKATFILMPTLQDTTLHTKK